MNGQTDERIERLAGKQTKLDRERQTEKGRQRKKGRQS